MNKNNSENEFMISVPYDDFVAGLQALRVLISIRQMIKNANSYASSDIKAVLGFKEENNNAGNDRE